MTKSKYIVSGGIAFSEKKDLKILKKYAAKGWIAKRYKGMGYELEEGEPEIVDYSIDVRNLTPEDEEEYFAMFEFAGWQHVCSNYNTHLFKAPVGTTPIYSDTTSKSEKLLRLRKSIMPAMWLTVCLTVMSYFAMFFSGGIIEQVLKILFYLFISLMFPCVMMYIALTYRSMRIR